MPTTAGSHFETGYFVSRMDEDKLSEDVPSVSEIEDESKEDLKEKLKDVLSEEDKELKDVASEVGEGEIKKKKFPKSVFFIVGNEFCERFSYYGMRAVLTLYLTSELGMSDNTATIIYHTFVMCCYFSPILGAWLADSILGKFRTILYVSMVYALGNIVLSLAATPDLHIPMTPFSMIGLALIALGTGGIKPCVSAFGGDQFDNDQVKFQELFFFVYYFSINAGSLISTFVTPILRSDVHCFGDPDSCFTLAFGLPAALMIISIIVFVAGKSMYRIRPPKDNIVAKVSACTWHALRGKMKSKTKREHWLDYAEDKYSPKFVSDVKAAFRVMYLYIPLPIFWALFEQQGSTWTIQATEMDGRLTDNYVILPDQMQVVNPLFILIFIPIFERFIYPLLARCNLLKKPLTRIFTGGILAAVAFFIAGFVQLKIETGLPVDTSPGTSDITFINTMNCSLNLESPTLGNFSLPATQTKDFIGIKLDQNEMLVPLFIVPECEGVAYLSPTNESLTLASATPYTIVLSSYLNNINLIQMVQSRTKPDDGDAVTRVAWSLENFNTDTSISLQHKNDKYYYRFANFTDNMHVSYASFQSVGPAYYNLFLPKEDGSNLQIPNMQLDMANGGVYTVAIQADAELDQVNVVPYQEVSANKVKMLYQVPQYLIITMGEIMFSITGLAFSYSQAPASMKSVLQAAWLLTDAFGNVIIIILESIPMFKDQSSMFFLYAGIMVAVMLLFVWMSYDYVYVTIDSDGNVRYPSETPQQEIMEKTEENSNHS